MSRSSTRPQWAAISALGIAQILAWGMSYYLPAVLAKPAAAEMGWPFAWVVGGYSLGLLAAGIIAPRVGRTIEERGGRPVLALSAAFLALGLLGLGLAPEIVTHTLAWLVMGVGMGAGLYDAAFAALGRLYGEQARRAITALTLFGGFASTVCWPLTAFLIELVGWRGACFIFAAVQLAIVMPLYLWALPGIAGHPPAPAGPGGGMAAAEGPAPAAPRKALVMLLVVCFTLSAAVSAIVSVHLIVILEARGLGLAAAVGLGALVGPSQVGARVVEMLFSRHIHPIWTLIASTVLTAAGIFVLLAGLPIIALGLVLYGAGLGIRSIARGTVPLALFGAHGYATLMGRLAMPTTLALALAPLGGAMTLDLIGASGTLAALAVLAAANVAFALALYRLSRR